MTASIDDFAKLLFNEAKAYLEKSRNAASSEEQTAYLHASLLLGCCSLEAHLNSIADNFITRPDLTLLDQSILGERTLKLNNGEYQLTNELKMFSLEDRIEYLFAKFSTIPLDKSLNYWGAFKLAVKLRNELTHPKIPPSIDVDSTERALQAILDLLNAMYKGIYGRQHPSYNLGTTTTMVL
jgi:hypothetical protein